MRVVLMIAGILALTSCSNKLKLAVPDVFKEQANELHVKGSHKNRMSLGSFTTSRIKRGLHVSYPGWGRGFFLENIALNQVGVQKTELVTKEKASFRYTLTNGNAAAEVYGKERELTRNIEYRLTKNTNSIFNRFEQVMEYRYVFSALIKIDSAADSRQWELMMTNIYDRSKDTSNTFFKIIRPDDNGLATNGTDSIFIKPISLKNTEDPNGKKGKLLIKMLGGYELSTVDGVVAILDVIDSNLWLYKELNSKEQLTIASIATALLARKVNDTKW